MPSLSLNPIVQVTVVLSPVATVRSGFDLGLILGGSTVLETTDRVAVYTSLAELLDAGFQTSDPEYQAAALYFAQNPPPSRVAVGVKGTEESYLEALTACREANTEWYACYPCGAAKSDIVAMAPYVEAVSPEAYLFCDSKDEDIPAGTAGNLLETLKEGGYRRTLALYTTTEYGGAAVMGYAMGANTGDPDSAFTLRNKPLADMTPEPLTAAQVTKIEEQNGNLYLNRGVYFDLLEPGISADGSYFDEVLYLDILVNNIKRAVMDLLQESPKVPQTEGGVTAMVEVINGVLDDMVTIGFIGPGAWTGPKLQNLNTGDTLPKGYLVQTQSLLDQSRADRENRKAPDITIAIKLTGAIESAAIALNVNR